MKKIIKKTGLLFLFVFAITFLNAGDGDTSQEDKGDDLYILVAVHCLDDDQLTVSYGNKCDRGGWGLCVPNDCPSGSSSSDPE